MPHGAASKKRKLDARAGRDAQRANGHARSDGVDTSKPTAVFTPTKGRSYTLSIAIPGSVIANCQTHDLKTLLAGNIARAAAVFTVDEIIVFNDGQSHPPTRAHSAHHGRDHAAEDARTGYTGFANPDDFLYHLLSYLECPPYLRQALFPLHPNLRTAGQLPSLDMPHHLKAHEWCQFREGVTVDSGDSGAGKGSYVDCGLQTSTWVEDDIPPGTRVTLRLPGTAAKTGRGVEVKVEAVAPELPREEAGYYWGYACRMAESLSAVFTECPFEEGYDLSFGTSERGRDVAEVTGGGTQEGQVTRDWQHMVVVFGGVAGLEAALKADAELTEKGVTEVKELFDHWVNVFPGQGSRTIRTEEAVWIGLTGLRQVVNERGMR